MHSGWSPAACYVLLSGRCGPVAQRLEQGTHNLVFSLRYARVPSAVQEQTRPQTTISDSGKVNTMSTTRVERNGNNGNRLKRVTLASFPIRLISACRWRNVIILSASKTTDSDAVLQLIYARSRSTIFPEVR